MIQAATTFGSSPAAFAPTSPRPQTPRFGCADHGKADDVRQFHSKKVQTELDAQIAKEGNPLKRLCLKAIRWYQKNDVIHNGYKKIGLKCAYRVEGASSCSQYGLEAFQKYGVFKGFFMTLGRILNCNPVSVKTGLTRKLFVAV